MPAHTAADQRDSRLSAWIPSAGSADADLSNENDLITARTRDLIRNNPIAAGVKQTLCDNVIGSQLRLSAQPQYRLLGKDKDWATEWGNSVEDEFATWAETTECDISRTQSFLGLSVQAYAGTILNGDALAIAQWQPRKGSRWSTRLQTVEADRLATPPWLSASTSVRNGIEIDKFGAPVAYWIMKNHPGDRYGGYYSVGLVADQGAWERIPAFTKWGRRNVIHLYDKERSGQSRGKSIFAAVMREFKIAGDYLGSELQAAASNALIAAFLESDLDKEAVAAIFGATPETATGYWKDVADKWNRKKMEGGMFVTIPTGSKLSGFNPNRPNTAFNGFMESVMRHMSAGLNIPYELLLKDFSKTNYSSARAAMLEAWRYFLSRRRWFKEQWLDPIYEMWLEEAINTNRVEAPDYYDNAYAYRRCRWVFSGRGWVDPVKEVTAAQMRMSSGISTLEQECAEQGQDWEEVIEQRAREEVKRKELGLTAPTDIAHQSQAHTHSEPDDLTAAQENHQNQQGNTDTQEGASA